MRKLSESEQELWESYCSGTIQLVPTTTSKPMNTTRPVVTDVSVTNVLDLHHLTLQEAHRVSTEHLTHAYYSGIKKVQHITGKSGQISQEFETWVQLNPYVRKIKKQNDGGAWLLWLKRK